MLEIIHNATLADNWKAEVERKMEQMDTSMPLLLSSFYTLSPTNCNFNLDSFRPYIQRQLQKPQVKNKVVDYNDETKLPETPTLVENSSEYKKKSPVWDEFNPLDQKIALESHFEFGALNFNFPILSLFTHIGIRIPEAESKDFCLWPACQPRINNRAIDMKWVWDDVDKEQTALVKGIKVRDDLGWSAQKVHFLPYEVTKGPLDTGSTKLKSAISTTTSGPEEDDDSQQKEDEKEDQFFDGNLHAQLISYEVAVKAYEAIAVSWSLP